MMRTLIPGQFETELINLILGEREAFLDFDNSQSGLSETLVRYTDNGNILIDLHFDKPINPPEMEIKINMIPGVVETGLFTKLKKLDAFIGYEDGTVKHIKVR